MIIIDKSVCILSYFLNIHYFERFNEVTCETHRGYGWRNSEDDSAIITYNFTFIARSKETDELFIELRSRFVLKVKIEDELADAVTVFSHLQDFHNEMNSFIQKNSLSFYSSLYIWQFEVTDSAKEKMLAAIRRLANDKKYEDLSDAEREQILELTNMQSNFKRIVNKKMEE